MYYVTMTDRFMSDWGYATGKTNKLVLTCDTWEEAKTVEQNALHRSEMKYINIRTTKPYYDTRYYYVSWHDKDDYEAWYQPNSF